MVALEWLKAFEIGLREIDDDHREMLRIMQDIKAAGEARDRKRCARLLDDLVDFSKAHFAREEQILNEIEYPSRDVHEAYHANLLERAGAVKEACKAIRSNRDFRECCEEIFSFLIDDVIAGDMKIKSFLQERGIAGSK
jgi:hemerythrin